MLSLMLRQTSKGFQRTRKWYLGFQIGHLFLCTHNEGISMKARHKIALQVERGKNQTWLQSRRVHNLVILQSGHIRKILDQVEADLTRLDTALISGDKTELYSPGSQHLDVLVTVRDNPTLQMIYVVHIEPTTVLKYESCLLVDQGLRYSFVTHVRNQSILSGFANCRQSQLRPRVLKYENTF